MNRILTFLSVCAIYPIFASINNQSTDLVTNETIDFELEPVIDSSSLNRSSSTNQMIDSTSLNRSISTTQALNQSNQSTIPNSHQTSNNFTCDPGKVVKECSYHGICQNNGKGCVCNDGYISSQPSSDSVQCDYKQKDTLVAFLLELILGGVGAGYFYLGQISLGIGQLCFFIFGLTPIIFIICAGLMTNNDECVVVCAACYSFLWFVADIGWWITALSMIANGTILDGNGMPIPPL